MARTVRIPRWACSEYEQHGRDHVCADYLTSFTEQGSTTEGWDMAPRVHFGRGWLGIGAAALTMVGPFAAGDVRTAIGDPTADVTEVL